MNYETYIHESPQKKLEGMPTSIGFFFTIPFSFKLLLTAQCHVLVLVSISRHAPWGTPHPHAIHTGAKSRSLAAPSCHDGSPTTPSGPISPAEHHSRCSGRCHTSPFPSLPQGGSWPSHIAGDSSGSRRSGWSGQQPLGSAVPDHTQERDWFPKMMWQLLPPSCCDLSQRGLASRRPISGPFHVGAESARGLCCGEVVPGKIHQVLHEFDLRWIISRTDAEIALLESNDIGINLPVLCLSRESYQRLWLSGFHDVKRTIALVLVKFRKPADIIGVVGELDNYMSLLSQFAGWTGRGFPLLCSATHERKQQSRHQVKRLHWHFVVTECPHGHCKVIVPGVSFGNCACPQECLCSLSFLLRVFDAERIQGIKGFDAQPLFGFSLTGLSE